MSQINYNEMSKDELKHYFLRHRDNKAAFQAYLDRINQHPLRIITTPGDADFDEKVQAAIRQKLEASSNRNNLNSSTGLEPAD